MKVENYFILRFFLPLTHYIYYYLYLCTLIHVDLKLRVKQMERPTLMNAAGWMALPIGFTWSASFFCTMYGTDHPFISLLSTVLGLYSIYMLYRQLTNYRRLYPATSWLYILRLSFATCLMAGLLTDAAQYAYFLLLDNGRLLSQLGDALQREEYRQAWIQIMPEADMDEVQRLIQSMTVQDIMLQFVLYNALLALPVSLLAALPVKKVIVKNEK